MRHRGAAAVKHAGDVHRDDPVPALEIGVGDLAAGGNAGIVHQHIDAAEPLHRRAHQRFDLAVLRHIGHAREHALLGKVGRHLFQP
jgi:hypothetical protein